MTKLKFRIDISYFDDGITRKLTEYVTTSSVGLAWRSGVAMVPQAAFNNVKIQVNPVG